jgi:hypothetical protein
VIGKGCAYSWNRRAGSEREVVHPLYQ